ncbi:MAG: hypothetical protein V3U65_13430 [Granulosicoccaceae bacterium]
MPEPGYGTSSSTSGSSGGWGGGYNNDSDSDSSSNCSSTGTSSLDSFSSLSDDSSSKASRSRPDTSSLSSIEALSKEPTTCEVIGSSRTAAEKLSQNVVDDTSTLGAATTAYNAQVNGITAGPVKTSSMKFGRFEPNSVKATAGYGIEQFAKPHFGGHMAKQTMVSSQAAYDYARTVDPSLARTRFEATVDGSSVTRSYDIELTASDGTKTLSEVKAGKSINATQLTKDVNLAKTGQAIDYVFTGNPITGNSAPAVDTAAKLAKASTETAGKIAAVVSDVAVTSKQIDAVVTVGKASGLARGAGKILGPAAVALDIYTIGSAVQKDGGTFGPNTQVAVAETAGGWAGAGTGAWAGAQAGATIGTFLGGPVGTAVGGVVGGVVGAIGGAIGGSWVGNKISSWF